MFLATRLFSKQNKYFSEQTLIYQVLYMNPGTFTRYFTHGVRYGGGQGAMAPQFLEKINEFLKFTIDF